MKEDNKMTFIILKDNKDSEYFLSLNWLKAISVNGDALYVSLGNEEKLLIKGSSTKIKELYQEILKSIEDIYDASDLLLPTINISRFNCEFI